MTPGKIFDKQVWFIMDHRDNTYWVYHQDGSTMFVAQFPG